MASLLILKSMLYANAMQETKKKKKSKKKKLENKTLDLDVTMCRLCNEQKGKIHIFENYLDTHIPQKIQSFADITMSETDNLPKSICQNCLNLLNECIRFRDLCQTTNYELIELSIKKEAERTQNTNLENSDEDSYNVPSPAFSDTSPLWSCTTCNKEFIYLKTYNKHLLECNKQGTEDKISEDQSKPNKSFLCDICGKVAKSNASLLIHMGTHENVFPFKCEQCPYQGRTMDLLKVHKRSHLADKPYKCTQCPKATTTSSNLSKHMRHVHSTTRPFKCTYCEKGFSYQHDLKRHIRDIHLRQGTVTCDVCNKKFNTKKILQGHRWKIHKIKGDRQGRLPMYLQYQSEDNDNTRGSRIMVWEGSEHDPADDDV